MCQAQGYVSEQKFSTHMELKFLLPLLVSEAEFAPGVLFLCPAPGLHLITRFIFHCF